MRSLLNRVKFIALVGASARESKPSYQVLKFLHAAGYTMLPVNPNPDLTDIDGLRVYPSLAAIDRPVDMVDVFRPAKELYGLAEQAIAIRAKVLWGQFDIVDEAAATLARNAGLSVVMDRCPKIELQKIAPAVQPAWTHFQRPKDTSPS